LWNNSITTADLLGLDKITTPAREEEEAANSVLVDLHSTPARPSPAGGGSGQTVRQGQGIRQQGGSADAATVGAGRSTAAWTRGKLARFGGGLEGDEAGRARWWRWR